jgi:protein MpaA
MAHPARFLLIATLAIQASAAFAESNVVDAWCDLLGNRLHSVSAKACRAQNFTAAQKVTTQGHALVSLDIEPSTAGDPAMATKRILVIGGIHGDELTAVSIVFRWLDWVQQPNAAIYQWRMIPLANPDGLLARPSTRVNASGVDLNRNFQTPDWDKNAQEYWIKRTRSDPRRYPGTAAGSEIETRWLQAQIDEFRPDLIISIHAPYNLLDYDGPVPEPLRFGRLSLNRLGVYPGSMGNYSGLFKQIPVITIELPNANSMPSLRDQQAMWVDMLKWMKQNIEDAPGRPSLEGASPAKPEESQS